MQITIRSARTLAVTMSMLLLTLPFHPDCFSQEAVQQQQFVHRLYGENIHSLYGSASVGGAREAVSSGAIDEGNKATLGPPKFFSLAVSPSGHIFAGTYASGVIRSTDNGETWKPINACLTNTSGNVIIIHSSGQVFAGTNGSGVFRSTNDGDTWTPSNVGIEKLTVYGLTMNSAGHILAGTHESGVWQSTVKGKSWTPINNGMLNSLYYAVVVNSAG